MADEGGRSRSSSLEKQRRFLGRDRYMGFQDEPLHGSDSGGRPELAQRAASGIPLDVRDEGLCTYNPHLPQQQQRLIKHRDCQNTLTFQGCGASFSRP